MHNIAPIVYYYSPVDFINVDQSYVLCIHSILPR